MWYGVVWYDDGSCCYLWLWQEGEIVLYYNYIIILYYVVRISMFVDERNVVLCIIVCCISCIYCCMWCYGDVLNPNVYISIAVSIIGTMLGTMLGIISQ